MAVAGGVIAGLTVALGLMSRLMKTQKAKAGPLLAMVGVAAAVYILGKSVAQLGKLGQKNLEQGLLATLIILFRTLVSS